MKDSEFALEFTETLRQLDGNFISTNRYLGRSLREGAFLFAEFNNPSVEEFVDELLKSEPSLLANLLQAIVCFRQASKMASRLSEIGKSRQVPKASWLLLRERAAAAEAISGGHLINYRPYGEPVRRAWAADDNDLPRVTRVRFQIEAEATLNDEIQKQLQERVGSSDGWISLLQGFQSDDSHAYGVQHLHEWVQNESRWPEAVRRDCLRAFRRALFLVIEDEDEVWASSLGSLRIFAELALSDGVAWSEQEQELFRSACALVSRTILNNDRSEEDVRHEAEELSTIEKITKLPLKKEIERLESRANDLIDRPRDEDAADPEARRIADPSVEAELDLDSLFAGLLDR